MAEATPHTWTCPSCARRVPLRAAACHCGTTRARAEELQAAAPLVAAAPVARGARDGRAAVAAMTTDVKLLLAVGALVLVGGLGWLLFAPRAEPYPAVLGYVDGGPPPKAARTTAPPGPPFKLPWWK